MYQKILIIICIVVANNLWSQLSIESLKYEEKKISTKGHPKANGMDIEIFYPSTWEKTEGKRPHVIFNFASPDKQVRSSFLIKDIMEGATEEEKKSLKSIDDVELNKILSDQFPTSKNCVESFLEQGYENIKDADCQITKVEGLKTSITSAQVSSSRAGIDLKFYAVMYSFYYKLKLISVSFNFSNITSTADRKAANLLASKIMNSVLLNNIWK